MTASHNGRNKKGGEAHGPMPFANATLGKHRHVCAFLQSADEEDRVVLPFIKDGLNRGEKAFQIVDPKLYDEQRRKLASAGIDIAQKEQTGQFELWHWGQAYLFDGRFDCDRMLSCIRDVLHEARAQAFPLARVTGHAEWAAEDWPGVEDFLEYECRVNNLLPAHHDAIICLYDISKCSDELIDGLMKTHPVILKDGILQENPQYMPPHQYLKELRERKTEEEAVTKANQPPFEKTSSLGDLFATGRIRPTGGEVASPSQVMTRLNLTQPLSFQPIFQERIWGGRKLESKFGKRLPRHGRIGESWEIVDREEAQSVVREGPLGGKTLHHLWSDHIEEIFGEAPTTDRFPLLIKLLDAQEKLSLQVHPPVKIAAQLKGEPKTEFWYVAAAEPDAELFVGLREPITRDQFAARIRDGTVAECVHKIQVKAGDAMFLPSGRFHAIGAGNLLVEVQQNSDTTYRVFDWNRLDENGKARQLHVEEALQSIDFDDRTPALTQAAGESLVRNEFFEIQKWDLQSAREVCQIGQFVIVCCLGGSLSCADARLAPGEFFLVPASLQDRQLKPQGEGTSLLRITIPV